MCETVTYRFGADKITVPIPDPSKMNVDEYTKSIYDLVEVALNEIRCRSELYENTPCLDTEDDDEVHEWCDSVDLLVEPLIAYFKKLSEMTS